MGNFGSKGGLRRMVPVKEVKPDELRSEAVQGEITVTEPDSRQIQSVEVPIESVCNIRTFLKD